MRAALAAALASFTIGAQAAEQELLALGGGLHYSEGDYGSRATTEITALQLTARYDYGRWTFRGTLPLLEVTGPGTVVPGIGAVRPGAAPRRTTTDGLGEPVVSASYVALYDAATRAGLDLTARVKLGLADDERLGTDETDVGFQVDGYRTFDALTVFAGLGYTFFGSSRTFPLRDVFNWTLGASYRLGAQDTVGVFYDEREALTRSSGDLQELMFFWSRQIDRAWKAQPYLLVGLDDGSPDWGAGLSLTYAF